MCSARKETVQRNNNKKAPKSKQIRSFVSLTSCSLMDSATASLMKKEKKERRKSEEEERDNPLTVCVSCSQATWSTAWRRDSDREKERERPGQNNADGRGQLERKAKWCRHSPLPGKPTLFQRKMANGKHRQLCSDKKSHDCPNTTPYTPRERRRE